MQSPGWLLRSKKRIATININDYDIGDLVYRKVLILMLGGLSWFLSGSVIAVTVPPGSELQNLKQHSVVIAYARATGQDDVTFTEHFHNTPEDDDITVSYWSADGVPLAVKKLEFKDGGDIPDFELYDYRRKRVQRVTRDGNTLNIAVYRTDDTGARTRIKSFAVEVKNQTIVDAGFHRHILKSWDALLAGKSRRVNFLRVEKGNYIPLVVKKRRCDVDDGSVCFRIALNNILLKNLVPDIKLAYDPRLKRLIRYSGLGPLNKINGKGMEVNISYEYPE